MFTRTWAASDGSLRIVISLHRYDAPTDREWSEYIQALTDAMVALKGNRLGIRGLSISDGGGPNGAQREQLNAFMKQYTGGRGAVSIVTANSLVRAIIKALSWFNPQARGFAPAELANAIDYLGLTAMQRSEFEFTLNEALVAFPLACVRGTPSNWRRGWPDHSPSP